MPQVRFTVFGRVAVTVDGVEVPVRGRRERGVLAVLLAAHGRALPADRVVAEVFGPDAGEGATAALQVAVSRLRALLEPGRAPRAPAALLVSSGRGYALAARPASVDAWRVGELVQAAHAALGDGDAAAALAACAEVEALWSGVPYGNAVDSELVRIDTARLEELHLVAAELRAEAELVLGRHALVAASVEGLVAEHPYRERLRELQVLALYRSGRAADALASLRAARSLFDAELGVPLSPALSRLEADVLSHAPSLLAPPPSVVDGVAPVGAVVAVPRPASAPDCRVVDRRRPARPGARRFRRRAGGTRR